MASDTTSPPLISLLVRSMDRPTLARALDSIAAQTYPRLEIVVVAACGAAHRPLPAEYRGRPLRLIVPTQPLTRAQAANMALDAASGELLNFLDDDDELQPEHLDLLFAELSRRADCVLAYSLQHVVDAKGRPVAVFGEPWSLYSLYRISSFAIMGALFRRVLCERGARFDERFEMSEDHDFWLQCAQLGRFASIPRATGVWHAYLGTSGGGGGDNNDDALRARAETLLREKWQRALFAHARTPAGLLEAAQYSLKFDPLPLALSRAERALTALPDDVNALNLAAVANFRSGAAERASELIARALEIAPYIPVLRRNAQLFRSMRESA